MKITAEKALGGFVFLLLAAPTSTNAIVGIGIERQGTNIVISWPSQGNEHYLIQFRQTLDPGTPWTNLTNNYPANSTNRTTFTLYGVVPPPGSGGGGGGASGGPPPFGSLSQNGGEQDSAPTVVSAMPADGSGALVPLVLYPPGVDLSNFLIYDPAIGDWTTGSEYVPDPASVAMLESPQLDAPQPGGWDDLPPNTGFFRVFHIPDWAFNVTNFTYDGWRFLPVDFKDYRERVDGIKVLLDGQPSPYSVFIPWVENNQTNWGMGIYFDRISSGNHQLQLMTTVTLNENSGDNSAWLVLSNRPVIITVDNLVSFTNWDDLILSTNYTFRATTKTLDTDWWIDIYDWWGFYVNGASGHTTNGQIQWTWDLTDLNGNTRDVLDADPLFDPEITFTTNAQQVTVLMPIAMLRWPQVGYWLISYLDRFIAEADPDSQSWDSDYQNAVALLRGGPNLWNIPSIFYPIRFGTNYTQAERDESWDLCKAWMGDVRTRNLYYSGHGGGTRIGGDAHAYDQNGKVSSAFDFPGSKALATSQQVRDALNSYSAGLKQYRFVFLDGCLTANGDWPETFGIAKQTNDLAFYSSTNNPSHARPSAFMGWSGVVGGNGWGNLSTYWAWRGMWMGTWAVNKDRNPDGQLLTVMEQTREASHWVDRPTFWGGIRVYGYVTLRFDEYNRIDNW